jgi:hypothetical protein
MKQAGVITTQVTLVAHYWKEIFDLLPKILTGTSGSVSMAMEFIAIHLIRKL